MRDPAEHGLFISHPTFNRIDRMMFSPLLGFVSAMLGWALAMLSLFLILLILVQRGRGGGLTGALGGPGGQSAFGTKAGDLFTRITSFVALGWIGLCAFTMWLIGSHAPSAAVDPTPAVSASPADRRPADTSDMIDLGDFGGGGATLESRELTPAVPSDPAGTAPVAPGLDAPVAPGTAAPVEAAPQATEPESP
jgi:preprotein translocase subunit SecG